LTEWSNVQRPRPRAHAAANTRPVDYAPLPVNPTTAILPEIAAVLPKVRSSYFTDLLPAGRCFGEHVCCLVRVLPHSPTTAVVPEIATAKLDFTCQSSSQDEAAVRNDLSTCHKPETALPPGGC
jgi:hypothetical protein